MNAEGTLTIIPVEALIEQKPSSRFFEANINSFIKFTLGDQTCLSKVCERGGMKPQWYETLVLKKTKSDTLLIELFDKRTMLSDQMIGSIHYDISGIVHSKSISRH